ncbi:MAG: response regulator transcription factor [Clostridiales bacterium]|nr:response regulator transcription factor [Clostridiales bacterium]
MFRIAVCDDEKIFADEVALCCRTILEKKQAAGEVAVFSCGRDLVDAYVKGETFDLLLLDILMDGMDGIELATAIRELDKKVPIVFVTSTAQYALKGYEVQAYRYLLKPVKQIELEPILAERLREKGKKRWLSLKDGAAVRRIPFEEIIYVETAGRKAIIHTDGENFTFAGRLAELENELPADRFLRCHQSYILNFSYVFEIHRYEAVLTDHTVIPISRTYWEKVKSTFLRKIL